MFGYITPLKPELKIKEFNLFQGYYCGVCMSIKKNFGNIPRVLLNYDMTFLALLLDGLSENKIEANLKRCIAHPFKKKIMVINNEAIDYSANLNVALSYFKILDDVNDNNDLKSKALSLLLSPYNKKFSDKINDINYIIKENLSKLSELETSKNFSSIDEICEPFSIIVGKLLQLYPNPLRNDSDKIRNLLYKFGYTLGKWIYLVDALDDLKDDMENDKFNPINYLYNKDNLSYGELKTSIKERLEFSIFNCAYNCKEIFDKLEIKKNKDILENIISLGMMDKYIKVINNCNCKKKGSAINESL